MDRLSRAWSRLSTRRPTLATVDPPLTQEDDELPDTKNEVFQLFQDSSVSRHRKSEGFSNHDRIHTVAVAFPSPPQHPRQASLHKQKSMSPKLSSRVKEPQAHGSQMVPIPATTHEEGQTTAEHPNSQVPTTSHPAPPRIPLVITTSVHGTTHGLRKNSTHESPTGTARQQQRMHRRISINEIETDHVPKTPYYIRTPAQINVPSGLDEQSEKVNRRNSVFVKRGSVSMEPIKKIDLEQVYTVNKQLGTGRFGYIKLAEHKQSKQKIAIKFFPRPQIKQVDFIREYNYSFFLSPHQHIIDTYEGMFQASDDSAFFFVQEFCPRASLREAVEATNQQGIGESNTKKVFAGVMSAIEFMHNENLVHRNLKAENILLFDQNDYSKVKVTDFGLTRKVDSVVKNMEFHNQYQAPELVSTVVKEALTVNRASDVWALGIIFFYCIRGKFPWQKAHIMVKSYWEWEEWLKGKSVLPKKWTPFSEKALKLMKKTLGRQRDRWTAKDMRKWIAKEKLLKSVKTVSTTEDYVYHSTEFGKNIPKSESSDNSSENRKKSTLQHWISTTLSTMAEISEQVVSARDD